MPLPTPDIAPNTNSAPTSGFAPLRIPLFRDRWIAATVSALGTWMQDTAGTWLMTVLTASPLLIALMQTAASLPVLLFGLLAGATADIFDRRKLLIFWQSWMLASVAILAVLTFLGHISPWTLLAFTALLNVGSAMNNPAWQAIVPELVPRALIPDTVSLNAASNNLARALGPALGGLMVAAFATAHTGAGSVFALNAVSFAGVIWVLVNWHRTPLFKSALPAERIAGSIRGGLRYVRYSPQLQSSLVRAFTFCFFVSAIWSLLAVVARHDLHSGPLSYGILNGALGVGALISATQIPRIRRRISADRILAAATLYQAFTLLILAFVPTPAVIIPTLVLSGFAWTATMSSINTSVQLAVPPWVTARALAAYLMTFQGGMALGAILWGFIAEHTQTRIALASAAAGLLLTLPIVHRFKILQGPTPDFTPYKFKRPAPKLIDPLTTNLGAPHLASEMWEGPHRNPPETDTEDLTNPAFHEGPVRISVEYRIPSSPTPSSPSASTSCAASASATALSAGASSATPATPPTSTRPSSWSPGWTISAPASAPPPPTPPSAPRSTPSTRATTPPRVTHQIYAREIT